MFRPLLATLFLAQLAVMSIFLKVDDPRPDEWYELRSFGVGGVVEVEADRLAHDSPNLEIKLANSEREVLFQLLSDQETTRITTPLSTENVDSSTISLAGLENIRLVIELQSEGVFVDLVGVDSVVLPYPEGSWSGNINHTWDTVNGICRVYISGNVKFTKLRGYVLV